MRLLISNDDGVDAPGLAALAEAFASEHDVFVVAPATPQSAQSHSLTLHKPLRVTELRERWYSVSGTPADCVYLGLYGLVTGGVDLVLSGINHGGNLGNDVHYSGTVAAAREAVLAGVPAIAVSLHLDRSTSLHHWDTAQEAARRAFAVAARGLPPNTLLSVNVPDVPRHALKGVRPARLGVRRYDNRVHRRADPWGRDYFWIGGDHVGFEPLDGSDGPLIEQGWATVTPLHSDPTLHPFLEQLGGWLD